METFAAAQVRDYTEAERAAVDGAMARIEKLCAEAREYGFASVCVNSCYASLAARLLAGSDVAVCCVIGFPLGAATTAAKAFEAADAAQNGATEIDMVINVGAAKDGRWDDVEADIAGVAAAIEGKALLKVIIETCLLTDGEKIEACRAAVRAGADFVKTSTGFSRAGATAADVALMRKTVGPEIGVKAAGGIRTYADDMAMIEAGASRIGASAGIAILAEAE